MVIIMLSILPYAQNEVNVSETSIFEDAVVIASLWRERSLELSKTAEDADGKYMLEEMGSVFYEISFFLLEAAVDNVSLDRDV